MKYQRITNMQMTKRTGESGLSLNGALMFLIVALLGSGFGYLWGHSNGVSATYTKWLEYERAYQQQVQELEAAIASAEQQFNEKEVELNERIKEDKAAHDAAIAAATRTFTERLRKSEGRAKTYAAMSQASADERAALADHAAKLDQSLEEGRHLVRELRETLGQRDREIMLLGEHIQNVYQLINNTGNSNGTADSGNS